MPESISKNVIFTVFIILLIVMHSVKVIAVESIELVSTEPSGVAIKG